MCECNYRFSTHEGDSGCFTTHFTQVVWAASTELGIGMATGLDGDFTCSFVVGRYKRPGNWGRKKEYVINVPQGSYTTAVCSSLGKMVKDVQAEVANGDATNADVGSDDSTTGSTGSGAGGAAPDGDGTSAGGGAITSEGASGTAHQQGALMLHNKLRRIHGTPEMKLNAKMNEEAQAYANVLLARNTLRIRHSDTNDGENIGYDCADAEYDPVKATKKW